MDAGESSISVSQKTYKEKICCPYGQQWNLGTQKNGCSNPMVAAAVLSF